MPSINKVQLINVFLKPYPNRLDKNDKTGSLKHKMFDG